MWFPTRKAAGPFGADAPIRLKYIQVDVDAHQGSRFLPGGAKHAEVEMHLGSCPAAQQPLNAAGNPQTGSPWIFKGHGKSIAQGHHERSAREERQHVAQLNATVGQEGPSGTCRFAVGVVPRAGLVLLKNCCAEFPSGQRAPGRFESNARSSFGSVCMSGHTLGHR